MRSSPKREASAKHRPNAWCATENGCAYWAMTEWQSSSCRPAKPPPNPPPDHGADPGGGKPERRHRDRRPGKPPLDHGVDPSPDFRGIIGAGVAPIREQLIQADRDAARLRVELIDLLISERSAVDLAEYAS